MRKNFPSTVWEKMIVDDLVVEKKMQSKNNPVPAPLNDLIHKI